MCRRDIVRRFCLGRLLGMRCLFHLLLVWFGMVVPLWGDGVEVAVPLWHQGGDGPKGLLRQMAPRWEVSVQFGMRFGGAFR